VLVHLIPDDLLKYGLIPEFVGRLPVQVSLDNLDKAALVRILTEPKNAIVKQYQKFLQLDRVELVFTSDALDAAAEGAIKQKTGARGLRTIIEDALLNIMYEIPSRSDVKKVIINGDVIKSQHEPLLVTRGGGNAYSEDESA
jgi:ATP-dependent Clp protease ATP-binding subunit ClpX